MLRWTDFLSKDPAHSPKTRGLILLLSLTLGQMVFCAWLSSLFVVCVLFLNKQDKTLKYTECVHKIIKWCQTVHGIAYHFTTTWTWNSFKSFKDFFYSSISQWKRNTHILIHIQLHTEIQPYSCISCDVHISRLTVRQKDRGHMLRKETHTHRHSFFKKGDLIRLVYSELWSSV